VGTTFFHFVTNYVYVGLTDRRTDRRTDRQLSGD